jgi:uncharacterized membrane protein
MERIIKTIRQIKQLRLCEVNSDRCVVVEKVCNKNMDKTEYKPSSWLYAIILFGFLMFLTMLVCEIFFVKHTAYLAVIIYVIALLWATVCYVIMKKTKVVIDEKRLIYISAGKEKENIPVKSIKYAFVANFMIGIDVGEKYRKVIPYIFKNSSQLVELINVKAQRERAGSNLD